MVAIDVAVVAGFGVALCCGLVTNAGLISDLATLNGLNGTKSENFVQVRGFESGTHGWIGFGRKRVYLSCSILVNTLHAKRYCVSSTCN